MVRRRLQQLHQGAVEERHCTVEARKGLCEQQPCIKRFVPMRHVRSSRASFSASS